MSEWKLVPVKLTPEMAQAIESADMPGTTLQEMWQPAWDAALAAAPADPADIDEISRDVTPLPVTGKLVVAPAAPAAPRQWDADPAPRELTAD